MSTDVARQRVFVLGLHLIALGLLALQVYVRGYPPTATAIPEPNSPEAHWWGLWPITYLPDWMFAVGAGAIVLLVAILWWRELTTGSETIQMHGPVQRAWSGYVLGAISVLLVVAFFAFPIAHTRWGDAYILSKSIAWPDLDLRLTRSWQAPLDVYLHSTLWQTLGERLAWQDATPVYRLLSPLAGALYLGALLILSGNRRLAPNWLTFALLASLGVIQLFFGYIENYSFAAAAVLVYMWLGINVAQQRRPLWTAASALAFANALHPSTLVLGPSLLYLGWLDVRRARASGNKPALYDVIRTGTEIVAPVAVVYGVTWIMMETGGHGLSALFSNDRPGGGDARWLVPLREATTEWEHYTLFSWPHVRDFLNEQWLIAPIVLPSLIFVGVAQLLRRDTTGSAAQGKDITPPYLRPDQLLVWFLVIATGFYLLFVWMWNPDYGGQRDWDLFSLVAIPESLLLVYALTRSLAPWRYLAFGAAPLIAVQVLHTAAWIYQNTLPWQWP